MPKLGCLKFDIIQEIASPNQGTSHKILFFCCPDLRCWLTNRRRCQLRSQRSVGTLVGNQLLPNASLECDEKALIDMVDGLSSEPIVLVSVINDNLADHDARITLFFLQTQS